MIAKHIVDGNVFDDTLKILATDYNNDSKIQMNDVMMILKEIENNKE